MHEEPRIFLCYASEDKKRVDNIYLELRGAGLTPWMDKPPKPFDLEGIKPGEQWDIRIREVIRKSAYFIAFLSRKSVSKRGYVQKEYRVALDMMSEMPANQIFLIPALLEDCSMPEIEVNNVNFKQLQWFNLQTNGIGALIRLFEQNISSDFIFKGQPITLHASTSEEIVYSIGYNRVIYLEPKDYFLNEVIDKYLENIFFEQEHDGNSITIRNVKNLRIVGSANGISRLIVSPKYATVLKFEDCENITLSKLSMGHGPEKGYCTGGVIGLTNCSNFIIDECDLYGCGTDGMQLIKVRKLLFNKSIIRECTYGIMHLIMCDEVRFTKSKLHYNQEYYGITINRCREISFDDCLIMDNSISGPIFDISSSSQVLVSEGKIQCNSAYSLVNNPEFLKIVNVDIRNNSFKTD